MNEATDASDKVVTVSSCHCTVHCSCPLPQVSLLNMTINWHFASLPFNTLWDHRSL